ncbi:hypothetical protein H8A95_03910 [Bradyrhizobium sp. Pear76]|uniref:DUF6894 family protein n=1 Tax=Bradyrhizobium oropedii TaxID=1571201 RepID=UPI001E2BC776|nr:hypothetical protein [Bradyrhizobium oropedii]MCC8961485.1 hypothetical protein [Bradyrhizobium oropedii]
MPRFYFDFLDDGGTSVDETGAEFPSREAAKREALETLGVIARDLGHRHLQGHVAIHVRDDGDPPFLEVAVTLEVKPVSK